MVNQIGGQRNGDITEGCGCASESLAGIIISGGNFKQNTGHCTNVQKHYDTIEKTFNDILRHMDANGYKLNPRDKMNIENQIHNLKIYLNRLNHSTKLISDNRKNDFEREIRNDWNINYNNFKIQQAKVLSSLTMFMKATDFV